MGVVPHKTDPTVLLGPPSQGLWPPFLSLTWHTGLVGIVSAPLASLPCEDTVRNLWPQRGPHPDLRLPEPWEINLCVYKSPNPWYFVSGAWIDWDTLQAQRMQRWILHDHRAWSVKSIWTHLMEEIQTIIIVTNNIIIIFLIWGCKRTWHICSNKASWLLFLACSTSVIYIFFFYIAKSGRLLGWLHSTCLKCSHPLFLYEWTFLSPTCKSMSFLSSLSADIFNKRGEISTTDIFSL